MLRRWPNLIAHSRFSHRGHLSSPAQKRVQLWLLALEERALPTAIYHVTIPGDNGFTIAGVQGATPYSGDLRWCIDQANHDTATISPTIAFDLGGIDDVVLKIGALTITHSMQIGQDAGTDLAIIHPSIT